MKIRLVRRTAVVAVLALASFVFSACGSSASSGPVNFEYVGWPEAIAKTNVASTMVEALGYETDSKELTLPAIF